MPSSVGNVPVRLFRARSMAVSEVAAPSSVGMVP
jgi:hypothetical protein